MIQTILLFTLRPEVTDEQTLLRAPGARPGP